MQSASRQTLWTRTTLNDSIQRIDCNLVSYSPIYLNSCSPPVVGRSSIYERENAGYLSYLLRSMRFWTLPWMPYWLGRSGGGVDH
jgi:hypothetical protein